MENQQFENFQSESDNSGSSADNALINEYMDTSEFNRQPATDYGKNSTNESNALSVGSLDITPLNYGNFNQIDGQKSAASTTFDSSGVESHGLENNGIATLMENDAQKKVSLSSKLDYNEQAKRYAIQTSVKEQLQSTNTEKPGYEKSRFDRPIVRY